MAPYSKYFHGDAIASDGMFDRAERLKNARHCSKQFPSCLPPNGLGLTFRRSGRGYFDIRKFPKMRVHHAGRPLADKKPATFLRDKSNEPPGSRPLALS